MSSESTGNGVGYGALFGVWSPIETVTTERGNSLAPTPRLLLLCASGRVEIGWYDSDKHAKRPRPYWYLEGRNGRTLDMRADQPTHWMPLPPNLKMEEKSCAEAIRLGHAEWVADAHGQPVFRWKEVRP